MLKLYEDVVEDDDGPSELKKSIDKYKLELRRVRRRCSVDGCNSLTCALSSSLCMGHMTTFIEQQESKGCCSYVIFENLKKVVDDEAVLDEGCRLARVASAKPADTSVNASGYESNASHGKSPELSIPDLSNIIDETDNDDFSFSREFILGGNHEIHYHDDGQPFVPTQPVYQRGIDPTQPVSQHALFAKTEYLAARGSDTVDEGGGYEVVPPPLPPAQFDHEDCFWSSE